MNTKIVAARFHELQERAEQLRSRKQPDRADRLDDIVAAVNRMPSGEVELTPALRAEVAAVLSPASLLKILC